MSVTDLSLLKANLSVTNSLDDVLLQHKLDAAEAWVVNWCDLENFPASEPTATEAALQIAALWFEQREAASFGGAMIKVPFGVHDMLRPLRNEVTGHADG